MAKWMWCKASLELFRAVQGSTIWTWSAVLRVCWQPPDASPEQHGARVADPTGHAAWGGQLQ